MSFSSPAKQKLSSVLGSYAANELETMIAGLGGPVVHVANEEVISGRKMFSVSIGVNGISYLWPHENLVGVLTNDGDGNLEWRELTGSGTVSEVGLIAPNEYLVGDPVRSSGNLKFEARPQQPFTFYAGPTVGAVGRPCFRKINVADLPSVPVEKVVKLQEALDSKVDVVTTKKFKEEIDDSLDRKLEGHVFASMTTDVTRQLTALDRSKFDVSAAMAAQAKVQQAIAQKIDREEVEKKLEALGKRLDDVVELLNGKVSTQTPAFQAPATVKDLDVADGATISTGHNKGMKIASSKHQKLGFFGLPPVAQPSGDVLTSLANLGLIKDPSLWISDVVGLVERIEALESRLGGE